MVTTVQIDPETHRMLRMAKAEQARSYNEILKEALKKYLEIPDSLYGAHPDLGSWTKADRARTKDEIIEEEQHDCDNQPGT